SVAVAETEGVYGWGAGLTLQPRINTHGHGFVRHGFVRHGFRPCLFLAPKLAQANGKYQPRLVSLRSADIDSRCDRKSIRRVAPVGTGRRLSCVRVAQPLRFDFL